MDFDLLEANTDFIGVNEELEIEEDSKITKQKKHQARRKIEDLAELRRIREELGWSDDLDVEFV